MSWDYFTGIREQYGFLEYTFLGNSVFDFIITLALFLIYLAVFALIQKFLLARLLSITKETKTRLDDTFVRLVDTIKPPFYSFVAFYFASNHLSFTDFARDVLDAVLIIWVVYQVVLAVTVFLDYVIDSRLKPEERNAESAAQLIKNGVKVTIWIIGGLFLLSNLGVDITTLIAGLGVGGIAIAFALQNILGDLFSSFAIFFDKPFREGDFIVVGTQAGTVEKIGIKTTRVRSLQGEEIVFSNQELTSAQIQNYKKLERRRVVHEIGVAYDTPQNKMKKIPKMIEEIIVKVGEVSFDRAHFKAFGDSALIFEIVYHIDDSEYNVYMDKQQEILLGVKGVFEKEKIEIAYPTQTIYIHK